MNILLVSIGFKNNDVAFNKNQIINTIKDCSKDIDLIVFGYFIFSIKFVKLDFKYRVFKSKKYLFSIPILYIPLSILNKQNF